MISRLLRVVTLTVLFPTLLSLVVYYGFVSSYSSGAFDEHGFRAQYQHSVYGPRVLGRGMLLETVRVLNSDTGPARLARAILPDVPPPLKAIDRASDRVFYGAYFLLNTFFLILSACFLYFLLFRSTSETAASSAAFHMVGTSLIALTQFVVVPYDTMSYASLLLSFLCIVRPFRFSSWVLLVAVVLGTLTRESSVLTLSFFFAYHFPELVNGSRRRFAQLAAILGAFLATYAAAHFGVGREQVVYRSVELAANFSHPFSLVGIVALPLVAYALCSGTMNPKRCLVFALASSPYIVAMHVVGMTWELRLWTPVWLALIVLAWGPHGSLPEGAWEARQGVRAGSA